MKKNTRSIFGREYQIQGCPPRPKIHSVSRIDLIALFVSISRRGGGIGILSAENFCECLGTARLQVGL
jgi:hypothetical protein